MAWRYRGMQGQCYWFGVCKHYPLGLLVHVERTTLQEVRKVSLNPNARTVKWALREGYIAVVVERWSPFPKPWGKRHDLWGFVDVLAIKNGVNYLWQATTTSHMNDRVEKILSHKNYLMVKNSGAIIQVVGWSKKGARGKRKLWEPTWKTL